MNVYMHIYCYDEIILKFKHFKRLNKLQLSMSVGQFVIKLGHQVLFCLYNFFSMDLCNKCEICHYTNTVFLYT